MKLLINLFITSEINKILFLTMICVQIQIWLMCLLRYFHGLKAILILNIFLLKKCSIIFCLFINKTRQRNSKQPKFHFISCNLLHSASEKLNFMDWTWKLLTTQGFQVEMLQTKVFIMPFNIRLAFTLVARL